MTEVLDKFEDIAVQDIKTNNTCERQNGLNLKLRSKTMRGFENPSNVIKFTSLEIYLPKSLNISNFIIKF